MAIPVSGLATSSSQLRRSWAEQLKQAKESGQPLIVLNNNRPEAVVIDYQLWLAQQENMRLMNQWESLALPATHVADQEFLQEWVDEDY